jgi:outer membrane biosynthesis protein TonB
MSSLAALITAAIIKVAATDPAMDRENGPSADEARDAFTEALLKELGLGPVAAHAPVSEPETKKAAPKKRAAKKEEKEEDVVVALTAAVAELSVEPKPKKAKTAAKKKEEPVPEPVVPVVAPVEKKKPGPKPKAAKAEGPVNLEKLTPTHKKHLKTIAEELKVETRDKEFLAFANGMSAEEWSAKALDDHIRSFLTPVPPPLADPPTEFLEVEFKGKSYLVDPETKFVYATSDEDDSVVRARDHVGVVGILEFAHMKI